MNDQKVLNIIKKAKDNYSRKLSLGNFDLNVLPSEIFKLFALQQIDLSFNNLENIPKEISNLKSLKIINLKSNKLKVFPLELMKIPTLEEINLEANFIEKIPNEIANFKNLKKLSIGYNHLESLDTISELVQLQELDLNGYLFESVPDQVEKLMSKNKKLKVKNMVIIPGNMEECFKELDRVLGPEEKAEIKNMSPDDLALLHFNLGLWIRNNWIYPKNSRFRKFLMSNQNEFLDDELISIFGDDFTEDEEEDLLDIIEPDDISMKIIEDYKDYLTKKITEQE
jgi:Leucine-rich repeat (LRR) protein